MRDRLSTLMSYLSLHTSQAKRVVKAIEKMNDSRDEEVLHALKEDEMKLVLLCQLLSIVVLR